MQTGESYLIQKSGLAELGLNPTNISPKPFFDPSKALNPFLTGSGEEIEEGGERGGRKRKNIGKGVQDKKEVRGIVSRRQQSVPMPACSSFEHPRDHC